MKSYALCPISTKRIDERVARLNAASTVVVLICYVIFQNSLILILLLIDFLARSLELSKYSPISILSNLLLKLYPSKPILINAGPKLFAARIGLTFSIAILGSVFLGLHTLAISLLTLFAICAILEAVIGFCLACQIYPLIYKILYKE